MGKEKAMKKKIAFGQPSHDPDMGAISTDEEVGRNDVNQRLEVARLFAPGSFRFRSFFLSGLIPFFTAATIAACAPSHSNTSPQQVEATPPSVTYTYNSDTELIEANSRAIVYCSKYTATPVNQGMIIENPDGTKTITFQCAKAAMVSPPPPTPPMSYLYSSDTELLQALHSADLYCQSSGQKASTSIVANPNGTKTLTFQCVPR
jgi:hypothetical protein